MGRRLGESGTELHLALLPITLFNKGVVLHQMDRPQEALAVYEEVIRGFEEKRFCGHSRDGSHGSCQQGGRTLRVGPTRGRNWAAYEEMLRRFGECQTPDLLEAQAAALTYKGMALRELGRPEEGRAALEDVVEGFRDSDSSELSCTGRGTLSSKKPNSSWSPGSTKRPQNAASQVINDRGTQSNENLRRAHVIRAKVSLRSGNSQEVF